VDDGIETTDRPYLVADVAVVFDDFNAARAQGRTKARTDERCGSGYQETHRVFPLSTGG
jgi:hypothetical protein